MLLITKKEIQDKPLKTMNTVYHNNWAMCRWHIWTLTKESCNHGRRKCILNSLKTTKHTRLYIFHNASFWIQSKKVFKCQIYSKQRDLLSCVEKVAVCSVWFCHKNSSFPKKTFHKILTETTLIYFLYIVYLRTSLFFVQSFSFFHVTVTWLEWQEALLRKKKEIQNKFKSRSFFM